MKYLDILCERQEKLEKELGRYLTSIELYKLICAVAKEKKEA